MIIAVFIGVLAGIVGTLCLVGSQLALNISVLSARSWVVAGTLGLVFVPIIIGCMAAALHWLARVLAGHHNDVNFKRLSLSDLFESYLFGVFILHPLNWLARGLVSLAYAVFGGVFGLEGGVIELTYAALPLLSRYVRLIIDEKQVFVICTIAASIAVALGVPFTGGLLAVEIVHVLNAKVRRGAVVSALTAYGTGLLFQSTIFSNILGESAQVRSNVLVSLFDGLKPLSLEPSQWVWLGIAALCLGLVSAFLALITMKALARGSAFASDFFRERSPVAMLFTGTLIAATVWFMPELATTTWKAWDELSWMRISTPNAVLLLVCEWTLLVLAFSGWGSAGLFSPMLLIGALLGYAAGNFFEASWALPLAIAGGASLLGGSFRVPIAASALVLEVGHDGQMWCLATLSVFATTLVLHFLKVKSLPELLLERHEVRIVGGRAASLLANLKARDAMFNDIEIIPESADFNCLREAAAAAPHNYIGVVRKDGSYLGLLSMEHAPTRVRRVLAPTAKPSEILAIERVVEVRDLINRNAPTVHPNESLEKALELLQDAICVAVVDENQKIRGLLFESAIIGLYKREVARSVIRQA